MSRNIVWIVVFYFALLAIVQVSAHAEIWTTEDEEARTKILVGEKEYFVSHIWTDFLNAAFSETVWNEDVHISSEPDKLARMLEWYDKQSWDLNKKEVREKYQQLKQYVPWYADYIYRPNGLPRHNTIHKWDDEISIGIGWPLFSPANQERLKSFPNEIIEKAPPGNPFYNNPETSRFFPLIADEVEKIIPIIQNLTGKPVHLIMPDDAREATKEYARIRIIPENAPALEARHWMHDTGNITEVNDYERWLRGGVLFDSSDRIHMDGFFLPNPDNTIGLAVCKINLRAVPEELFRGLIRECLVRSLGLPDIALESSRALIGDWRSSPNSSLHNPNNNDDKGIYFSSSKFLIDPPKTGILANPMAGKTSIKFIPETVTPYDKIMISLLYCPGIASGMDKNEVINALTTSNKCKFEQ